MALESPGFYKSLIDRLVDEDPSSSHESVQNKSISFKQIEASVVKDLERLLNARRTITPIPEEYKAVSRSVFAYGLPDFTGENPNSTAVQRSLRQEIEQTIATFEPRLKNVQVRLERDPGDARAFAFRIIGRLVVEPLNEPIAFDTYFDTARSEYVITR